MRDVSLDIVKGIACILMIFAHSHTLGRTIDNNFTILFWYLGFFAPILFFASIGVSLIYQLEKRSTERIIIFNCLLFIVSFAHLGKEFLNYFDITKANLIGSLALATIFAVIFRKVNGLLMLIILLMLDRLLNKLNLTPSILHGTLFSIIPWVGITTLGKNLHENKKIRIFILGIGFLITFYYMIIKKQYIDSQFLTTLFLGASLLIYSIILLAAKRITQIVGLSSLLIYLGRNTLLFYFVHLFILFVITFKLPAILMWIFLSISSITLMVILKWTNQYTISKISSSIWFWIGLTIAVFLPSSFNLSQQFRFYFFSILTIIFALNYNNFMRLDVPYIFRYFQTKN